MYKIYNSLKLLLIFLLLLQSCENVQKGLYYQPDEDLGQLFHDVQTSGIFSDSKTFVDCVPRRSPEEILQSYKLSKKDKDFNLKNFVKANFELPEDEFLNFFVDPDASSMEEHLATHWAYLTREPDEKAERGTLLHLPYSYVVPGGRFREIYYWDSYFTMLGLSASNHENLLEQMLLNFAYLIDTYGHIPNGNRTYYLSRSQPPFFSSMVMLYSQIKDLQSAAKYLPQLEKEYNFWMDGRDQLEGKSSVYRRLIKLEDGSLLNRYWDDKNVPRPESYIEDKHLAESVPENERSRLYRNIRAACESGWDFSSRWLKDQQNLNTIITTQILPVDLNSLLYHLENTLAELHQVKGNEAASEKYATAAQDRKKAIIKYFWNEDKGYFYDYNFIENEQTDILSLAGLFPLYYDIADNNQDRAVANKVQNQLLKDGGVVTTSIETGQQWDYPNGWAPLQWITIKGLEHYNHNKLAKDIERRWLKLNETVFENTGKMMEKYNVVELDHEAGGGEYPLQDGFGWTNGVNIALIRDFAVWVNPSYQPAILE